MAKPKRKFDVEGHFDPSLTVQVKRKDKTWSGKEIDPKSEMPARFYTIETIRDLIERIKQL